MGHPAGNVLTKRQTIAGVTKSISYTYNLNSSVATLTTPNSHVYTYGYSNALRPVSLADNGNGFTYVQGAQYAAPGLLTHAGHGLNVGISETNTYNNRLQPIMLSAAGGQTVLSLSYNWTLPNGKNNGSVYQIQNNRDTTRSFQYTYDQLNRLVTAATYNATTWGDAYVYDNWGNLLQKNQTQGTAENLQVTVDAHNHINTSGFTYDAAGNLTWDGANALNFDAENRVTPATGYVYSYDGDDHRVEKNNAGSITYYWYDDNFTVIATTGALVRDYVYFNGRRVAYFSPSSGNQHYYWQDNLGSASVMSNSDGSTIEWESDNYPFGTPRVLNNGLENHFRFTGYEHDPETGDYYADYREQSPTLGRFFSADPYGGSTDFQDPQSLNLYAYVLNNPTNFIDPSGLDCNQVDANGNIHCTVRANPDGPGGIGDGAHFGPQYAKPRKTPSPPKINNSFFTCVKESGDYFSLQNGLKAVSGGKLGDSWVSSAFLGSSVSSVITAGQYFSSLFSSNPAAPSGSETASTTAGEVLSDASGPVASRLAPRIPNIALTAAATASVAVRTPTAEASLNVAGSLSGTVPLNAAANFGAKALNILGEVKLPYDLAVAGFSAVVCSIGR